MPVTLRQIVESKRKLPIKFVVKEEGEEEHEVEVNVVYNPSAFTPELETEINRLGAETETMGEPLLNMLAGAKTEADPKPKGLLTDWDIMLDPEDPESDDPVKSAYTPFPPTLENLRQVPFQQLGIILRAILSDLSPKKPSTSRSSAI